MKFKNIFKYGIVACSVLLISGLMSSCEESVDVGTLDESIYDTSTLTARVINTQDARNFRTIKVYNTVEGTAQVGVNLSNKAQRITDYQFVVDTAYVTMYNNINGTDYEAYPSNLVTFDNDGKIQLVPDAQISDSQIINIANNPDAEIGKEFMLPISLKTTSDDVNISSDPDYVFFVKCQGDIPNPTKDSGIWVNFYFEVNDVNILNATSWTLKDSGKPLADNVCIFAANVHYDPIKGPYIYLNPQVKHILDNRDEYIKPLQDMGITVTLSLLSNVANLSVEGAYQLAMNAKKLCDTYGLDGIELDDEYNDEGGQPGFESGTNSEAYVNFVYECKRIMPDKLVCVYNWGLAGNGAFLNPFKGLNPGEFIDYTYEGSYGSFNSTIQNRYLGMTKKQVSPYSRKLHSGFLYTEANFQKVIDEGYGSQMIYDYRAEQGADYVPAFNTMSQILFGEDIVWSGETYVKNY